jgi:exopolysaccharide biosynthesis WecB/TagA/CpsF family protein
MQIISFTKRDISLKLKKYFKYIFHFSMNIFWIKLNKLKYNNFLHEIMELKNRNIVFTPNPEMLLKSKIDSELNEILNKASYLTSDWIWLFIAYQINSNKLKSKIWPLIVFFLPYYILNLFFRKKYLYKKFWDRICWSDLTKDIINEAIKKDIKITILDLYNPNDTKKVKSQKVFEEKLKNKFKNLKFDYFIYNSDIKEEIIEKIKNSDSKILFSTLWMKTQEQSIIDVMKECKNIKLWLWVWSSFDYFTWFQKRAPKIWRLLWFEWLYRLITWPKKFHRLKRLWNAIFVFIWEVIREK